MKVTLSKSKSAEQVYITKSYRKNGKSTSKIIRKLGSMASLLPQHDGDREKVLAWAREQAQIMTEEEKNDIQKIIIEFSQTKERPTGKAFSVNCGYLFLQKICTRIGLKNICADIKNKYHFEYDLASILSMLIYARILEPTSKSSSYDFAQKLIEKPNFMLHDVYRALDILDKESDFIQAKVYEATKESRKDSILYYDCTNFFFETEEESGLRKYGKSKENRPSPIVQLGLFMDADGIPLAFTTFAGNENEQPSLIPLEKKILSDFSLSKFVVCTDAGLSSTANRRFNNRGNRSYIVTQSLKTLKSHLKEWALSSNGWHLGSSEIEYDLSKIDEEKYMNATFHKERWINEIGLEQRLIVSYSPKYKNYQRSIRERQINRAIKIANTSGKIDKPSQNSPKRFIETISTTYEGEIANHKINVLNTDRIAEEEAYDGFYGVCTTLEDDAKEILKINHRRWEIEETFRLMKSEFKARPVFLQKDERIRAHFLTCFLSLVVFRLLERELGREFSAREIISALKGFDFFEAGGLGYIPTYTRTHITDALCQTIDFPINGTIIPDSNMKKIIKSTKA